MGGDRFAVLTCFALGGCLQVAAVGSASGAVASSAGSGGVSGAGPGGTSSGQAGAGGTSSGQGSNSGTAGGESSGGRTPCATVNCNPGLVCDPADGRCKCYLGGPACEATQLCDSDGGCVDDPCFGVVCTATGSACYFGVCKCGGPRGVECSSPGNSCSPIDNSCGPTSSCAITPCMQPGTVCSPTDGLCHCGTISGALCPKYGFCQLYVVDGGPLAVGEDAGGAPVYGQCREFGNPCSQVTCPPLEACDPSNFDPQTLVGRCECGGDPANGIPGTVCDGGQSCIARMDGGPGTCLQD